MNKHTSSRDREQSSPSPGYLCPQALTYLAHRRIEPEFARAAGLFSAPYYGRPALWVPLQDGHGRRVGFSVRTLGPGGGWKTEGKLGVFVPRPELLLLDAPRIFITEKPIAALLLAQLGIAAIGTTGVSMCVRRRRDKDRNKLPGYKLVDALVAALGGRGKLRDREIVLVPDGGDLAAGHETVKRWVAISADKLLNRKAKVFLLEHDCPATCCTDLSDVARNHGVDRVLEFVGKARPLVRALRHGVPPAVWNGERAIELRGRHLVDRGAIATALAPLSVVMTVDQYGDVSSVLKGADLGRRLLHCKSNAEIWRDARKHERAVPWPCRVLGCACGADAAAFRLHHRLEEIAATPAASSLIALVIHAALPQRSKAKPEDPGDPVFSVDAARRWTEELANVAAELPGWRGQYTELPRVGGACEPRAEFGAIVIVNRKQADEAVDALRARVTARNERDGALEETLTVVAGALDELHVRAAVKRVIGRVAWTVSPALSAGEAAAAVIDFHRFHPVGHKRARGVLHGNGLRKLQKGALPEDVAADPSADSMKADEPTQRPTCACTLALVLTEETRTVAELRREGWRGPTSTWMFGAGDRSIRGGAWLAPAAATAFAAEQDCASARAGPHGAPEP